MKKNLLSSWSEEIDLEDLKEEASKCNISLGLVDEAREALTRSCGRRNKKSKFFKISNECWQ